jgi:DNA-binding MarR family transcriptional regulator
MLTMLLESELLQMNIDTFVKTNLNLIKLNRYLYQSLDMTQNHITILHLLLNAENQFMDLKVLSEIVETTDSVLSRQVKELEKRGYLTRQRYENNLRKMYIYMSPQQKEETLALMDLIDDYIKSFNFNE